VRRKISRFSFIVATAATMMTASAAGQFKVESNGGGIQQSTEEETRRLVGQPASRRRLSKSSKNGSGGTPHFVYEQDDDNAVMGIVNGKILDTSLLYADAMCPETMCFGDLTAILAGFTVEGADFLSVNIAAEDRSIPAAHHSGRVSS
jgi:hypothetical protein